jgi:coniferyl-aldehyde dehydrogenase
MADTTEAGLASLFTAQKRAFLGGQYPSLEERLKRLEALKGVCRTIRPQLGATLAQDFGSHDPTIGMLWELGGVLGRIRHATTHLARWLEPVEREEDPTFPGSRSHVRYQPKGVVGNMAPWNFPVDLTIGPLVDILAAGNRAIVKPSELAPYTGELVQKAVAEHFDAETVAVVTGGLDLAKAFARTPWDHLIYTGNPVVARSVMAAAAANLTPVTLELGGKCPSIVAPDRLNDDTFREILSVKAVKSGQVCLNTDYAMVPRARLEEALKLIASTWEQMFPTFVENPHATGIINERHYERLTSYVAEAKRKGARVIELNPGGETPSRERRKFPFTLVVDPDDSLTVMQDEIFGPILVVKTYGDLGEAIDYVNAHERPLALYVFTDDDAVVNRVLATTTSGGVSVNSIAVHVANPSLPFGGIGNSGMGYHHGYEGFQTFSHARAVFRRGEMNAWEMMRPPYTEQFAAIANALFDSEFG